MAQRRLTDERWRQLIGRQARSGLTIGAFCQREGIAESTFFAKRRQLNASPRFVEVIAGAAGPARRNAHRAGSLELCLPRGVTVRVESGFDPALLRAVVEALA